MGRYKGSGIRENREARGFEGESRTSKRRWISPCLTRGRGRGRDGRLLTDLPWGRIGRREHCPLACPFGRPHLPSRGPRSERTRPSTKSNPHPSIKQHALKVSLSFHPGPTTKRPERSDLTRPLRDTPSHDPRQRETGERTRLSRPGWVASDLVEDE